MNKLLLTTAAALALAACNGKSAEGTASDAANSTGSAASNAADATGSAMSNAGESVGNTASGVGDKLQDAAAGAVGLGSAALTNDAKSFVPAAAISDMYEIEASKLATTKAKSADVKKFATQMIADHTATTAKLKSTLKEAKLDIAPPTALDSRRQGMIDNLKAASADDFDKTYLDQQTAAHREAVTLMKSFADDGDNDALKKLASANVPKIQMHLDMAEKLDKAGADGSK